MVIDVNTDKTLTKYIIPEITYLTQLFNYLISHVYSTPCRLNWFYTVFKLHRCSLWGLSSDVISISGTTVREVSIDVCVNFGDSSPNKSSVVRTADFVLNEEMTEHRSPDETPYRKRY